MSYISVQPAQASMRKVLIRFASDEEGAAAIDWIALTTGILLIGVTLVYSIFNNGVGSTVSSINASLEAAGANVDTGTAPDPNTFGAASTFSGDTGDGDQGITGPVGPLNQ